MAQCETEGRKQYPPMDLYAGIFNTKLYSSTSRGSPHVGVSYHANTTHFVHTQRFHEDSILPSKISAHGGSFRDTKSNPGMLSDGNGLRSLSIYPTSCCSRSNTKQNPQSEGPYEGNQNKGSPLALMKKVSAQAGVDCASNGNVAQSMMDHNYIEKMGSESTAEKGSFAKEVSKSNGETEPCFGSLERKSRRIDPLFGVHDNSSRDNGKTRCAGVDVGIFTSSEKDEPANDVSGAHHNSRSAETALAKNHNGLMEGVLDAPIYGKDAMKETHMQGNCNAITRREGMSGTHGPSVLYGACPADNENRQGIALTRRSLSTSSEFPRFDRKLDNGAVARSPLATFTRDSSQPGSDSTLDHLKVSARRSFGDIYVDFVGGKSEELTDALSSHGGSSYTISSTAGESHRDSSKVSSFGNILISKGSPHSVSSRSMGSVSMSGSRCTLNELSLPQGRYGTMSGRKSAEMVPSKRLPEMVCNRKAIERVPRSNGHLREHAMVVDAMPSGGSSSNSNGNVLNGGTLLVGGTNGHVLSYGGGNKLNGNKPGDTINRATAVDCKLLKRAQASKDPEEVKNAGNAYYQRGHFAEALALYSRAVSLCPKSPAYRSNRAAALSGLGRLGEAVHECEEAIRLDSSYDRAHQRVAALYLRLGLLENAKQHFHAGGPQMDPMDLHLLHKVDGHIQKCIEARKRGDWQSAIRESDAAVVAGADSAPQIFGFKSEALLRLHKPEGADGVCIAAQRLENSLLKLGILQADAFLLLVRAEIDLALGRFEGAVEAATSAARIDPNNDSVSALLRKAQTVCNARTMGNELYKAGRYFEALASYAEGLESDPTNAVLLCNRAACRSKLGQWEKAVEDCDAALRMQPYYKKALMRRANCWTKLERWEDAIQDYEALRREMPEDLEIARGLFDAHVAMKKSQGEDTHKMRFGGGMKEASNNEQLQEALSCPGLSVVQYVTRWSNRCRELSPFVNDLCKRNPCVNFVKVDVEENPDLAKIESVTFIPTFKLFKNGQKVKEILGPTEQSLEYALKHYAL